jgi:23S rRNA (adenine2503-C2)-methyltransferase
MKKSILNYSKTELEELCNSLNYPSFRAKQLYSWLYEKGMLTFQDKTNLPKELMERLAKEYNIPAISYKESVIDVKGKTEKILWELADREYVESVIIKHKNRITICLSTQVGCKIGCPFCQSGKMGFKRNLEASEIVDQVLSVQRIKKIKITNIVFMGMGEPFDNYDNVIKAIRIINDPAGLHVGARKITISTCGIIPGIQKLQKENIQVELSISLQAVTNELRDKLVPINKKYPLEPLIKAVQQYAKKTNRIVTLEYILLKGTNDSELDAIELSRITKTINGKVNVIPGNNENIESNRQAAELFCGQLKARGIPVTLRHSKGIEILAACGQLAGRQENPANNELQSKKRTPGSR